jgi:hypothetical protein
MCHTGDLPGRGRMVVQLEAHGLEACFTASFQLAHELLSNPTSECPCLHIPNCCPVLDGAGRYRTIGKSKRAFKYNKNITIRPRKRLEGEMLSLSQIGTNGLAQGGLVCFHIFPERTAASKSEVE